MRTKRSRERANALLVGLAAEFGEYRVSEKTWENTQGNYDRIADQFESNHHGGAGVWVRDAADRVLLVRQEGSEAWSEPGGAREPGESFPTTAVREVAEETGLEVELTGVLEVAVVTHDAWDRPPLVVPEVLFTGEPVDGELSPQDGEIAAAEWWTEPPDVVAYEDIYEYPFPDA